MQKSLDLRGSASAAIRTSNGIIVASLQLLLQPPSFAKNGG